MVLEKSNTAKHNTKTLNPKHKTNDIQEEKQTPITNNNSQ
jgi:hypothetical protein